MSSFLLGPSRHCFFFPDILDASFFPIETAIFQIFPDGAVEHIKAICRPLQHLDGTGSQQIFWRHRQPEVAKQDWDWHLYYHDDDYDDDDDDVDYYY